MVLMVTTLIRAVEFSCGDDLVLDNEDGFGSVWLWLFILPTLVVGFTMVVVVLVLIVVEIEAVVATEEET